MDNISIIIPVFNSEKFLPDLFESLSKCVFYENDEVLFIDNGSTDASVELCQKMCETRPNIYRCLSYTEKASSYAARNYGVQESRGDILVFTDSDCKPTPEWLKEIRYNIKKGEVIAGKIHLEIMYGGLWEYFDTIAHLNSESNANENRVATANMAAYKDDFLSVGLFEERFSGGDYEWSQNAAKCGLKIRFVPNVLVYHPTRKTFEEILKKEQRIAFGAGNHQKNSRKPFITLVLTYVLKVFKFDTNIRYTKQLKNQGIRKIDLIEFNRKFMIIRLEQLRFVIKGYKEIDVRQLGIK